MIKRSSRIFFIVIFSFILIWGLANITGYFLINEFVKTDYFRDLIVEKLRLKNDANYELKINARIHWNPFAFGLVVKNSSFRDINEINNADHDFVSCTVERSDIKFSIVELVLGNLKPQEVFIKNGNCVIDNEIFQKNTNEDAEKEKRIDKMSHGIKTLDIRDSIIEFNKKKYFIDLTTIKKRKRKIEIDLFTHNNYIKELKLKSKGAINYDEWNRIDLDINDLSLKLDEKSFRIFPKIDDVLFKSQGKAEIFLDDSLQIDEINFNLNKINGDFSIKEKDEKEKIFNGEISGSYTNSLKFEKIKLNLDNGEISGKGEFVLPEKLLKGDFDYKNLILNKITNFWPSTIAPNTKKFYESAIKSGNASGKVNLLLKFSDEMKFIEKKSRINLKSEIKDVFFLCCENKFPEIKNIDGEVNITLDDLNAGIKKAKINESININDIKVNLNFDQQKLFVSGKAYGKVKSFVDLYEKDYKIEIFGDDILKNIAGEVTSDVKLSVDLKNNNKIDTDIDVYSKNLSSLLEKNEWKIDQGEIFMKIKNDRMKIDFSSNTNGRKISLTGDISSKKEIYKMKFDESYEALKKTFDPIIGHLVQIKNRVSGEIDIEEIKGYSRMRFDFNLDDSLLEAKYLKLNKKIGEKATVNFDLDKFKNDIYLYDLNFSSEGEKKHKIKIENLKYSNDNIFINNIFINERNIIEKIEFKETKKERDVKVFAKNIFYSDFDWFGFTSEDPNEVSKKISIIGQSDKLSFHDHSFFSNIMFDLSCENGDCKKIILNNCKSSEETKINASIIDDRIIIATNDGGKLLNGLDITDSVDGGKFYLDGYLKKYKDGKTIMENALTMKNFRIKNAPVVARILNLASLGGLLSIFTGKGVHFNQLNANFVFFDSKAIFAKSIVDGQAMAIEFEGEINLTENKIDLIGSLMPFNFINMILRIIPVLGPTLVGVRGEGLIMIDFGLHGSLKNPTIRVDPMTFFTPYTLRKIFRKQEKQ